MSKLIVIGVGSARSDMVRIIARNTKVVEIVMVNKEDELPEDILEHIHSRRAPQLIVPPMIKLVREKPTRNVRPEFRNKVSDRYPKSNKRDRFPFSKRR